MVCWRNHLPLSECAARGDYNWYEIWGELNSRHCLLTGNIFYSPDYVNLSDREIYHNGSVSIPITSWLSLNGAVAYTNLENDLFPVIKSYTDWGVNFAATWENFTITLG